MPRNLFLTDEDEANRIRNTPEYKRLAKSNPVRTTQDQVVEYAVKNADSVSSKRAESAARKQKEIESRTPQRGMGDSPAEFSSIPNQTSSQSNELESLYTVARDARKAQENANAEYAALQAEWDANPAAMQSRLADPNYVLSETERQFALEKYNQYKKENTGLFNAIGNIGKVATPEELAEQTRMNAIGNKSRLISRFGSGVVESVPLVSDVILPALGNMEEKMFGNLEADGYTSTSDSLQGAKSQDPVLSGAGYMAGKLSQYAAVSPFLSGTKFAQAAGNALGGTKVAQTLSRLPILGQLATPQAISSIVGDTSADIALDTLPSLISDLYRYDSQQVDDTIPDSEKMQFSEVLQNAAGNVAGNVAFNAGGELLPSLFDAAKGLVRRTGGASASGVASGLSPQSVVPLDDFVGDARAAANAVVDQADTLPKAAVQEAVTRADAPSTGADEIIRMYNSGEQLSRAQLDTLKPNGSNRAAFESATGVKLPDTSSATRSFFSDAKQSLTPSDVSSSARAQAATGKPMQSSVAQKVRTLYDDIDRGAVDADEITRRVREIAENMVDRKSYMVGNDDSIARIQKEYLKQRIYINDSDLSDILYSSGAKNLSEFNKQYGTRLTRDDSAIPLDTWVMDLYSRTGENAGFTAVDDFLETLDSAKSFVARQFDESGYKQAVDDAAMSILNGYAPREVTQQYGVGAMKSKFDRDPVPTLDTQNQSAVRQLTDSDKVSDLKNVGTMQHEKYTDAQARYDAQNIIDAETLLAGSSDAAVRNIMTDLSAKEMWSKEDVKTAQAVRNRLIANLNATTKGSEEYRAALNELDGWVAQIAQSGTKSGQSLQAYKEAVTEAAKTDGDLALALVQKRIDRMNDAGEQAFKKKWKTFSLTDAEKELFRGLRDENAIQSAVEAIERRIAKEFPATTKEKIRELMRVSMLANPRTMIRNFAANPLSMLFSRASNRLSGVGEAAYGAFKKDFQRTQAAWVSGESKNIAKQVFDDVGKGLMESTSRWDDFYKTGAQQKEVFKGGILNPVIGDKSMLEHLRGFTYDLLEKGDAPFFRAAFNDRLASFIQARGIKSASEVPQEAIKAAFEEAMRATYKDDNAVTRVFMSAKENFPFVMDLIMPFVKTPVNVAARAVEYSPFGLAGAVKSGLSGQGAAEVINKLSKASLGSAGILLGAWLYNKGYITGPQSEDADEAAFLKSQGWLPFAINADGNYYTFDWAQPGTTPLVLGATIADTLESGKELDFGEVINIAKKSAVGLGDSLLEMSPLQSLADIFGGYGTPTENFIDVAADYPTRMIPSLFGAVARTVDPVQRSTYSSNDAFDTFKNEIQAKIPFLSKSLPASYNTWGNEIKRSDNVPEAGFAQFINPGQLGNADVTPIDDDISALYESTGNASVFPRKVNRYVTVNGNRVDLNNQQYSDWQRDAGQLSYDLAEQIVGSSMMDDQKAKCLSDAYSFAMAYTANDLFDSSLSSTLNKEVEIYNDGGSDLLANWYYLKAMGDGSPSQEETKAILDKMNISRAEKAILWEQTNSSWKTNPYK